MKKLSLQTVDGCKRLFALFLILIAIFSLGAQAISTRGFKISVSDVVLDVRGADLHLELYKPSEVNCNDSLPCMIITHGGSESLAACSMMAWELARRGFVVLNVSAYGAGLSGQPAILEDGTGEDNYNRGATMGMYDVFQYARSISYVDKTRIGSWAHSTGRHLFTKMVSYFGQNLTLNDRLLNVLYDDFGVSITEEQLTQDANEIAAQKLSSEQLIEYEIKKKEQEQIVKEYMFAARLTERAYGVKTNVAGFEVIRDPQMNLLIGLGTHEGTGNYYLGESDQYKGIFHTSEAVQRNCWYDICNYTMDPSAQSTMLGEEYSTNIDNSDSLKASIENRNARFFLSPVTIHNGMLWSAEATSTNIEFYTQVFGYNNGELSDPNTVPISAKDLSLGYATLVCTTLALISMLGMLISLAALLLKTATFASCAGTAYTAKVSTKSKAFWSWVVAATVTGFAGAYGAQMSDLSFTVSNKTMTKWMPWEPGQVRTYFMLIGTVVVGVLLFVVIGLINKNKSDEGLAKISDLRISLGLKTVLKTAGLGIILFAACYIASSAINLFFNSRFLTVDVSFELMKGYGFGRMLRYTLIVLPFTLVISALNNMCALSNVSDRKDTVINVFVTSLGMILMMGLGFILTYSNPAHAEVFTIHCVLSIITLVPICNYLYRKLFKLTGSIWLGAIVVALLLGWRLSGYISHQFMFYGPNELSAFWGIY